MKKIEFNKSVLLFTQNFQKKTIIKLGKAEFRTNDKNWFQKLNSTSILLKTVAIDKIGNEDFSCTKTLYISTFLSPNLSQPNININYTENFQSEFTINYDSISHWILSIELKGIVFLVNESFEIEYEFSNN